MSHLLKERRTKEELVVYLEDKTDDYILEQYVLSRIAFEEDVKKGRYSEHAENVRAMLKLAVLRRMAGLDKHLKGEGTWNMEYRVYDDRTNKTLFTGEHHKAIQFISANFDEDHDDFNHVWLEKAQ